jgi:hypothetical protein
VQQKYLDGFDTMTRKITFSHEKWHIMRHHAQHNNQMHNGPEITDTFTNNRMKLSIMTFVGHGMAYRAYNKS